ncbi:MAG TPA: hypothetical protein VHT94_16290 [Streptosporangiaceae bacterium]|nr:hypothetical protein [Streptosporangiaceae bacterium]
MARRAVRRWWAVTALAAVIMVAITACVRDNASPAGSTPSVSRSRALAAAPQAAPAGRPTPSGEAAQPGAAKARSTTQATSTTQAKPAPAGNTSPAVRHATSGQAWPSSGQTTVAQATWLITRWALARLVANPALRSKLVRDHVYQIVQPGQRVLPGAGAPPVLHFTSVASLRAAISRHRIPAGTQTVLYDPEAWRFTPMAEQRHPVRATRRAKGLAHAHGLRLFVAPGLDLVIRGQHSYLPRWRQFLNRRLAASLAAAADGIELQAQSLERDPRAYADFVRSAARQARQANPGVTVLAGLSTNPAGGRVTSKQLAKSARAAKPAVSGFWLNIPGHSARCPACRSTKVYVGVNMLLQIL